MLRRLGELCGSHVLLQQPQHVLVALLQQGNVRGHGLRGALQIFDKGLRVLKNGDCGCLGVVGNLRNGLLERNKAIFKVRAAVFFEQIVCFAGFYPRRATTTATPPVTR